MKSRIKIIYLTKPYKNYSSASYQFEFIKYIKLFFEVKIFEVPLGYLPNQPRDDFKELQAFLKKECASFDILMTGHHWLGDHPHENIIPLGLDFLSEINILKIAVLNKEWIRLPEKINYFNSIGCSYIVSHHPSTDELIKKQNIPNSMQVITSLFGVDADKWGLKNQFKGKKHDLFFSGVLQNPTWPNEDQAMRIAIEGLLFHKVGRIRFTPKYNNIFWNAFTGSSIIDFLNRYKRLDSDDYLEQMGKSFVVPVTLSMGIISPRIFEALACGAVPLVDNSKVYNKINNLEKHVVFFDRNLKNFLSRWNEAISLSKEHQTFKKNREFVLDNHSLNCRFISLQKKLDIILNSN
jgi:hypothetical protein